MLIVGFFAWINESLAPAVSFGVEGVDWTVPLTALIPQFIVAVIGVVGGILLLMKKKIGLYMSLATVAALFYYNGLREAIQVQLISSPFLQLIYYSQISLEQAFVIFANIYNACVVTMGVLLAVRIVK